MRKRAVVIDDDAGCRWFAAKALGALGYEVYAFDTTAFCRCHDACFCKAGETCVDIILTDNQMPGRTGLDFIREQRRKGCRCTLIGIMSGTWTDGELAEARELGCTVFAKPVSLRELRYWLESHAAALTAERELRDFGFDS